MEDVEKAFIGAINTSFEEYNKKGARSTAKLIPVHSFIAEYLYEQLGKDYKIYSQGFKRGEEYTIDGKYYPKKEDIVVLNPKNDPLIAISFKFVTSNYKQNSNNYFENLLGETANIRRKNIGFAHLLVLRGHTPYYNKNAGNKRGKQIKIEVLTNENIAKYVKLFNDDDYPHKPDVLGILIVDYNDKTRSMEKANLNNFNLSEDIKILLNGELSLTSFFKKVYNLCKIKDQ
ncbi:MAG: hypothetical protein ACP5MB_06890 [bacterium]